MSARVRVPRRPRRSGTSKKIASTKTKRNTQNERRRAPRVSTGGSVWFFRSARDLRFTDRGEALSLFSDVTDFTPKRPEPPARSRRESRRREVFRPRPRENSYAFQSEAHAAPRAGVRSPSPRKLRRSTRPATDRAAKTQAGKTRAVRTRIPPVRLPGSPRGSTRAAPAPARGVPPSGTRGDPAPVTRARARPRPEETPRGSARGGGTARARGACEAPRANRRTTRATSHEPRKRPGKRSVQPEELFLFRICPFPPSRGGLRLFRTRRLRNI